VQHRTELINDSDFTIMALYQAEYRGLVEYYRLAYNLHSLTELEGTMEISLTKRLPAKFRISVPKVYKKYQATFQEGKQCYKVLQVLIEREGKKPLVARWGGISLHWDIKAPIKDHRMFLGPGRSELEKRLLADTCEYCGTTGDAERIEVHHIRALKDLKSYDGREKPAWVPHYGGQETQNARALHHLPPGCDVRKTDETKAYVRLMYKMMKDQPIAVKAARWVWGKGVEKGLHSVAPRRLPIPQKPGRGGGNLSHPCAYSSS
jgi:hypothetical protein